MWVVDRERNNVNGGELQRRIVIEKRLREKGKKRFRYGRK